MPLVAVILVTVALMVVGLTKSFPNSPQINQREMDAEARMAILVTPKICASCGGPTRYNRSGRCVKCGSDTAWPIPQDELWARARRESAARM